MGRRISIRAVIPLKNEMNLKINIRVEMINFQNS